MALCPDPDDAFGTLRVVTTSAIPWAKCNRDGSVGRGSLRSERKQPERPSRRAASVLGRRRGNGHYREKPLRGGACRRQYGGIMMPWKHRRPRERRDPAVGEPSSGSAVTTWIGGGPELQVTAFTNKAYPGWRSHFRLLTYRQTQPGLHRHPLLVSHRFCAFCDFCAFCGKPPRKTRSGHKRHNEHRIVGGGGAQRVRSGPV